MTGIRLALVVLAFGPGCAGGQVAPDRFRVRFETSQGDFVLEAHRDWAPHGADRFWELVRSGYYDGCRFFRVIEGDFAQFGIHGEPSVGAGWRERRIPDDPVRQSNRRGRISFAMGTTPNDRTTQVFINLRDNSRLDAQGFAPFGEVVSGMEVVDRLYSGYGESAGGGIRRGKQAPLFEKGNEYWNREFPRLDYIRKAAIQ
jgi:cyclophilin family peptidyl-prolyl cis-trans isomerase